MAKVKRRYLSRYRPVLPDGGPAIPVIAVLRREVQRTEAAAEAAREDLRRWLLSNPEDGEKTRCAGP